MHELGLLSAGKQYLMPIPNHANKYSRINRPTRDHGDRVKANSPGKRLSIQKPYQKPYQEPQSRNPNLAGGGRGAHTCQCAISLWPYCTLGSQNLTT
jgi:hypothetical protein